MKASILILLFSYVCFSSFSQETNENRGTIKIQKKGQLAKVLFDEVNFRLVGIDQYGNVMDSAVVEFEMSVTIKGIFYNEKANGFVLSLQMQQLLAKCDRTSKIFFEKIKATDRSGNIVDMKKFQYNFAYQEENSQ